MQFNPLSKDTAIDFWSFLCYTVDAKGLNTSFFGDFHHFVAIRVSSPFCNKKILFRRIHT